MPDIQPRRFWRVLLQAASIDHLLLGKRVIPRSCFSHLVQLWNGYPSHYNGTFGRFAAFVDFLVYVLYVLCPSKAVQRCAACLYPNDRNANFCQVCGASTGPLFLQSPSLTYTWQPLITTLWSWVLVQRKTYQRQKSTMERQLISFLTALTTLKSIPSGSSEDIVKFPFSRDRAGRTVVHSQTCDRKLCQCPCWLPAGSVDSLIGKLHAIYNRMGCINFTNPLSHSLVKEYLKFTRKEQAGSAIPQSRRFLCSSWSLRGSSSTLGGK